MRDKRKLTDSDLDAVDGHWHAPVSSISRANSFRGFSNTDVNKNVHACMSINKSGLRALPPRAADAPGHGGADQPTRKQAVLRASPRRDAHLAF